ncbi:hypothetical protein pb186bvf_017084 [Paramecium bursaria]
MITLVPLEYNKFCFISKISQFRNSESSTINSSRHRHIEFRILILDISPSYK